MLAQATAMAKQAGKMPGFMKELISEFLYPPIDWVNQLRRFIEVVSANDYDWMVADRRFSGADFILPSLYSQDLGTIVIGIDTSGSMSTEELKIVGGALSDILSTCRPEKVIVIYCDTRVNNVEEFEPDDLFLLKAKGRGGTEFTPVFDYIAENNLDPKCLIYMTDLECYSYPKEPSYPVMWGTTTDNEAVPFGEVLKINIQ